MENKGCTYDEHQVMYGSVESLYCTPETNITCMLTNWNLNKNLRKKPRVIIMNNNNNNNNNKRMIESAC